MIRLALFAAAAACLAGCTIDPKNYETAPVTVSSPQGPVVCQLYTPDLVTWDRAIDRPAGMSVQAADALCLEEGKRRKNG